MLQTTTYINDAENQFSLLELSTLKYLSAQSLLKDARNTLGSDESVSVAEAWKTEAPNAEFSKTLIEVGRFVKTGSPFISGKDEKFFDVFCVPHEHVHSKFSPIVCLGW